MKDIALLKEVIAKKNLDMTVSADGKLVMTKGNFAVKGLSPESGDAETKGASSGVFGEPTDDDLKAINKLNGRRRKFAKEDVFVIELQSADTKVDRGHEHFTKNALQDMADMSPNKPVLCNHDWSTNSVVGKIFAAEVRGGALIQKIYIPRKSKGEAVEAVLDGLWDKVSVGFGMKAEHYTCDSCKKSIFDRECDHWPGYEDEKGKVTTITLERASDYFEISFVPVPMQPEAGVKDAGELEDVNAKAVEAGESFNHSIRAIAEAVKAGSASRGIVLSDEDIVKMSERIGGAIMTERPETIPAQAAKALISILEAENIRTDAELEALIKGVKPVTEEQNSDADTISTVKTTTEDSSAMVDEKETPQVDDAPEDPTSEVDPTEAEAPEGAEAKDEKPEADKPEAEAPVETTEEKGAKPALVAPSVVKLDASAVDAATSKLEALLKGVEPMVAAQKALETKLANVQETLDRLETLVKAASSTSFDSLKELLSPEKEVAEEKHWFVEAFGDLGGQE